MCTVTYLPNPDNNQDGNQFILTSNRDETPKRSAVGITKIERFGKDLLYPQDPLAKGTWIATSNANQLVCVLNGAFEKHKHRPPYRLSRGIMALDFFSFENAQSFFSTYEFEGIEPFTMIIFDDGILYELRWDETMAWVKELPVDQTHIWASCTLYNKDWQKKRRKWFYEWEEKNKVFTQKAILDFHRNAGEGNTEFDLVMNWGNKVRTTSITSVYKKQDQVEMHFEDILNNEIIKSSIDIPLNEVP